MDKNDQTQEHVNKMEGSGRINRPGKEVNEEEIASHDISQVDRQEGEMDHGESFSIVLQQHHPFFTIFG